MIKALQEPGGIRTNVNGAEDYIYDYWIFFPVMEGRRAARYVPEKDTPAAKQVARFYSVPTSSVRVVADLDELRAK